MADSDYIQIIESSKDGITLNIKGKFVFVNEAFCKLTGYTRDELIGKNIDDLNPPDIREQIRNRTLKRQRGEPVPSKYDARLITKNGNEIDIENHVSLINYQGSNASLCFTRDISIRKNLEKRLSEQKALLEENLDQKIVELKNSEEKLGGIFQNSPVGIMLLDEEGVILEANQAFRRMIGYRLDELIGKKYLEFTHPDDSNYGEDAWASLVSGERDRYNLERRYIRKSGEVFWARVTVSLLEQDNLSNIVIFEDITELKKAQEELIRNERLSAIGKISSVVGHELRNPLGVINNSVYYLNMKIDDSDPKIKRHLEIIQREVERSNIIISDLLDFARGPKPPQLSKVDLSRIIDQSISNVNVPKRIEIIREYDEIPLISLDSGMMMRVFINLINNAIDAIAGNGEIRINVEHVQNVLLIKISDTGKGIKQVDIEDIFKPLFTTKAKGVGLGLYTVKGIIEAHNGEISLTSRENNGATFKIKLPITS